MDRLCRRTGWSLSFNLAYGVLNGVMGFVTHSWWMITLCVYYILLSVMRFATLRIRKADRFIRRFCGGLLIALSVSLIGTTVLSVVTDRGVRYHEIMMIAIALYAFTKIVLSIIHLVKAKRSDSETLHILRNIGFADALVSIFSLQRSMLVTFEGMTAENIRLMNLLTGAGVCLMVFLLGINLVGGRCVEMAKSKLVKANEKIAETVVKGYKAVENAVVGGYTKVEDRFVEQYLTRDGETVEEAKKRLKEKE